MTSLFSKWLRTPKHTWPPRIVPRLEALEERAVPSAPGSGPPTGYIQTNLISDVPGLAQLTDPNLKNPWGTSFSADGSFSVSDQQTSVSTLYSVTAAGVSLFLANGNVPVEKGALIDTFGTVAMEPGTGLFDSGTVTIEFGAGLADYGSVTVVPGGVINAAGAMGLVAGAVLTDSGTVACAETS